MTIDYERMARVRRGQKSALTRAINSGDAGRVVSACTAAVEEWNAIGAWPDDWHRWNIALRDAIGVELDTMPLICPDCGTATMAIHGDGSHTCGRCYMQRARDLGVIR